MKNLFHQTDGNALIEVALFLPVLVTLLLGVVDFGVILDEDLRVADSVRSAAATGTELAYANNLTYIKQIATSTSTGIPGYSVAATQYCICGPGSGQTTCTSHTQCGTYGIPNQYVQVTATATLPLLFSIKGLPANYAVKSVAIARVPWTGTN